MTVSTIRYEPMAGWARITLHRPDKLNAFTAAMHTELRVALDRVVADGMRALVLTGAGRAFSAGQDLADRDFPTGEQPDLGATLERDYAPLVRRIRALELPVIAAVHGVAAGAGANVALACDVVIAGRSARFVQAFAKLGLVPDAGGTFTLARHLGPARAMGLALTAEPLTGEQAAAWGLIWRAVDDDRVLAEADALAAAFADGPTRGFALTKRAIQRAQEQGFDAQLDAERDLQREAGRTADYREGVRAFLEKRAPRFVGR